MADSVLSFILPAICVALFFISFDILVKCEHDNYHSQWKKDGEPTGNFWWPDGVRPSPGRSFASLLFMFGWLFDTPQWARENQNAKKLFVRYRTSAIVAGGTVLWLILKDLL
jgi:hypothetical protein